MDQVQKDRIENNLVELIKNTICTAQFLTTFQQSGILSQIDYEDVNSHKTPFEKSRRLYDILPTRTGAFAVLIKALENGKQTGALDLLQQAESKFQNFGLISMDVNQALGTGRSGTRVYKGLFDKREVAVKVVKEEPELAMKEVNILRKLDDHDNIVRYLMAEQKNDKVYIALELCLINLEDEIKMKLLKPNPIAVIQLCTRGLAFLHKNGIIHRDLKPANILLNRHGQVKISDFGFSKQLNAGMSSASVSGIYGTTDWMAPELLSYVHGDTTYIAARKMSSKADIFSLGCVFYYVLSNGEHLFGNVFQRPLNILNNAPQWGHVALDDTPKELIRHMIFWLPNQRPTADEILYSKYFKNSGIEPYQINPTEKSFTEFDKMPPSPCSTAQYKQVTLLLQKPKAFRALSHSTHLDEERSSKLHFADKVSRELSSLFKQIKTGRYTSELVDRVIWTNNIPHRHAQEIRENINATNKHGWTLLHYAAKSEPVGRLNSLINLGCEWEAKNTEGETILHYAAAGGNYEAVKYLVSLGADIEARTKTYKQIPLHYVRYTDKHFKETLQTLVDSGSDINARDKGSWNLILLATNERSRKDLEQIVYLGGDWRTTDEYGWSVLHVGAGNGNVEAVKYFIELGADVNSRDIYKQTPLHLTGYCRHKKNAVEVLRALVDGGSDITAVDNEGNTVFEIAESEEASDELKKEIVRLGGK